VGVDDALNIYIYTYFWELGHHEIVALAPAYPVGVMLGAILAPKLLRRFGKKAGVIFGTASWAGWQILPIVLRLLDLFPENGDALLVPLLIAIRVVQGASTVQANVAFGSMVADTIDEHELSTGKRQEGIFFASSSFAAKAASGMGNIIAGFALDLIDWPRGRHIKSAADVPVEAIVDLGMLYGPYVAGCGIFSVFCYTRYRLTRERHEEILKALYARRGGPRAA
jgi:Na+/melibiose symporter-like transporter